MQSKSRPNDTFLGIHFAPFCRQTLSPIRAQQIVGKEKTMAKAEKDKESQRAVAPWRPGSEFGRMKREMERMFEDVFGPRWSSFRGNFWPTTKPDLPSVNIDLYEENNEIVAKAELPGLDKDEIDVNVSDHILTIKGQKKKAEEARDEDYHISECCYGVFVRSIELPMEVQTDKATATFKNGVLEIRLPKTERARAKGITVKVE
jgi:HSP20 family protein